MRIVILGTGGVGGFLGAKLWNAGHDVVFVARGAHLDAMQQQGLRLETPEGNIHVNSTFTDSLIGQPPVDFIIIAVKSFDTLSSIDLLMPVLKERTTVLSFQNGVENEHLLAEAIGKQRILAGVAYILSTIAKPGVISHRGGTTKFKFGELDGSLSERCGELERVFKTAGIDGGQMENIQRLLWEKWVFICGLGGMTAYTRKPIGEILSDKASTAMLEKVVHEAATVARSQKNHDFSGVEELSLANYRRLPEGSTSSMYYDVTHGKRVEVEALNGAVVRFGTATNIPTPANEKIYDELKQFV